MKTLKLKKDVVEQLSSNQANHAMGGVKTIETCMNCPIQHPPVYVVSYGYHESACNGMCVALTYNCAFTQQANCTEVQPASIGCAPLPQTKLCVPLEQQPFLSADC